MNFRTDYDWSEVSEPITNEEVRNWIKVLEIGKYNQARSVFYDSENDCHCCLAVLATEVNFEFFNSCQDEGAMYWNEYADLTGDDDGSIEARTPYEYKLPARLQDTLVTMNDEDFASFADIAAFLKEGFNIE